MLSTQLASNSQPVILTNTPLNRWDFSSWTFQALSTHLKVIPCKISNSSTIRYHALDKPLQMVPEYSTSLTHLEVIMDAKEFFQRIADNNTDSTAYYYYSSGDVSLLKLSNMPKRLDENLKFPPYKDSEQVNYWFGSTNVTAYPHYDTSHNLHIVVRGKKRFIVYPPSSYKDLVLFPCLHSLYRQVQVLPTVLLNWIAANCSRLIYLELQGAIEQLKLLLMSILERCCICLHTGFILLSQLSQACPSTSGVIQQTMSSWRIYFIRRYLLKDFGH